MWLRNIARLHQKKKKRNIARKLKVLPIQPASMIVIGYLEILLAIACYFFIRHRNNGGSPMNLPFFGMLPIHLFNLHRINDFLTDVLARTDCTYEFKGPWFTSLNGLCTCDPANMHYILSKNFSKFSKGPNYKEILDMLGDGIFNPDSELWSTQRKISHSLINHRRFQTFLEKTSFEKVQNGLIPVLEHVVEQGLVVDLQDVFQRFMFDSTSILLTGMDPGSLSIEFPEVPFAKALDDAEMAIMYRHCMPTSCWKFQRWLGIGKEKSMSKARETLDQYLAQCISTKREQLKKRSNTKEEDEKNEGTDLLTSYMAEESLTGMTSDKFLRDTILNLMLAGKDTVSAALSWFFWLVSMNPAVETKILEEVKANLSEVHGAKKLRMFGPKELNSLVYLHGAFCESLRLFPPVPFQTKRPTHEDVLPSGHKVDPKKEIYLLSYPMGRMEAVWGKDCLEFKPERWISEQGRIKHEPSYKFMSFNAGPRSCLGKDVAFIQMKTIAATLIYNYHVEVVKDHPVSPKISIILHMKHGLMVRVRRRVI